MKALRNAVKSTNLPSKRWASAMTLGDGDWFRSPPVNNNEYRMAQKSSDLGANLLKLRYENLV